MQNYKSNCAETNLDGGVYSGVLSFPIGRHIAHFEHCWHLFELYLCYILVSTSWRIQLEYLQVSTFCNLYSKDYDITAYLPFLSIMWDGCGAGSSIAEGVGPTQRDAGWLVSQET